MRAATIPRSRSLQSVGYRKRSTHGLTQVNHLRSQRGLTGGFRGSVDAIGGTQAFTLSMRCPLALAALRLHAAVQRELRAPTADLARAGWGARGGSLCHARWVWGRGWAAARLESKSLRPLVPSASVSRLRRPRRSERRREAQVRRRPLADSAAVGSVGTGFATSESAAIGGVFGAVERSADADTAALSPGATPLMPMDIEHARNLRFVTKLIHAAKQQRQQPAPRRSTSRCVGERHLARESRPHRPIIIDANVAGNCQGLGSGRERHHGIELFRHEGCGAGSGVRLRHRLRRRWHGVIRHRSSSRCRADRPACGRRCSTQARAHLRDALRTLSGIDRQGAVERVQQGCAVVQPRPRQAQPLHRVRECFVPCGAGRAEGRRGQLATHPVTRDTGQRVEVDRGRERSVGFDKSARSARSWVPRWSSARRSGRWRSRDPLHPGPAAAVGCRRAAKYWTARPCRELRLRGETPAARPAARRAARGLHPRRAVRFMPGRTSSSRCAG